MTSLPVTKHLGVVNKPVFNSGDPTKPVGDISKNVVSNTIVPSNTGIQQTSKQSKTDNPGFESVFSEDTAKEKIQQERVQLPGAGSMVKKEEAIDTALQGKIPTKSGTRQNNNQQIADKEVPNLVLNKENGALGKDIIKETPSLLSVKPALQRDSGIIVSIKTGVPQKGEQRQAGKGISDNVLNKGNSAVNNDIIKGVPSLTTEIPAPIKEPVNIVSTKSETQQVSKQQKAGNEIPYMVLKKTNSDSIKTGIKPVNRAATEIATRKIEAIKSVIIKSDSLLLTLYDNGDVDGDTVSVLLNGKVIMPLEGLSLKAINKTIYLTPEMGDSIVLIMYAENLGSIPPNTGLLVIHDGDDIYEIRFSGDLKKNSSIILKRKK